ncbi:MAG: DegV family EDD domain-containing protein [Candidatus Marinimicrobia bacterium]|nr:DegV family EDD domain-containing protein [Candidatus Neomarinimicrobiota bacterium]
MSKFNEISSVHLYTAFIAGGEAVIRQKNYLNEINVFPVPDSDTGTNMASTMRSIMVNSKISTSIKRTMDSIADSALSGARGNSGIIFAQFLHGLREEIADVERLSIKKFTESLKSAIRYLYDSVIEPVEGTIITVIEDWVKGMEQHGSSSDDFDEVLEKSYAVAEKSLKETPSKMEILAKHNVVDAGAQGFVHFLEGVLSQIKKGQLVRQAPGVDYAEVNENKHTFEKSDIIEYRYCTEAIITDCQADINNFKSLLSHYGNSAIIAGNAAKTHFHIHTNEPGKLFQEVKEMGTISQIKVDDMVRQYNSVHQQKYPIALITDSAADLPDEVIEQYQIQQIPFKISFGENNYLDKLTLSPEDFYVMLENSRELPHSSQPDFMQIKNLFDFLTTHYEKLLAIHVSAKLTGVYDTSVKMKKEYKNQEIAVINSKNLSGAEGLLVLRAAEAIAAGIGLEEIVTATEKWVKNTRILTDVDSLKYMVKGGRVSPLTGLIAKILNLKPIVTVNEDGKGVAFGKSFSRAANMKKIIQIMMKELEGKKLWKYNIVHSQNIDRAKVYAEKLARLTGQNPEYMVNISPVIGVHNGIGTVAINYMFDD